MNYQQLLEETREILDGLSSGTLSPVQLSSPKRDFSPVEQSKSSSSLDLKTIAKIMKSKHAPAKLDELNDEELAESRFGPEERNALHLAALEALPLSVFATLLRKGVNPLQKDRQGLSPRQLLPPFQSPVGVEDLLVEAESRASCKAKLFRLCGSASCTVKAILNEIDEDSDLLEKLCRLEDSTGVSCLHQLVFRDAESTLRKLFAKIPQLNATILSACKSMPNGNNLLHEAARWGSARCAKYLLSHFSQLATIANSDSQLPSELAAPFPSLQKLFTQSKDHSAERVTLPSRRSADIFVSTSKSASADSLSREERKLKQIIGFIDQIDKETEPSTTPTTNAVSPQKKRGRPRLNPDSPPSKGKLKKLKQALIAERSPTRISSVPAPVVAELNDSSTTLPVKRGPGRPRKHPVSNPPPPKEQPEPATTAIINEVDILSGKCDLSLPGNNTSNHSSKTPALPVAKWLAESVGCVVLLRIRSEWWMLINQFNQLLKCIADSDAKERVKTYPLSNQDRQRLMNLPALGRLIHHTKSSLSNATTLIKKSDAVAYFAQHFGMSLNGPFGYVDVDLLAPSLGPGEFGVPLKLKLKMLKAGVLERDAESLQRPPKSPRILQM